MTISLSCLCYEWWTRRHRAKGGGSARGYTRNNQRVRHTRRTKKCFVFCRCRRCCCCCACGAAVVGCLFAVARLLLMTATGKTYTTHTFSFDSSSARAPQATGGLFPSSLSTSSSRHPSHVIFRFNKIRPRTTRRPVPFGGQCSVRTRSFASHRKKRLTVVVNLSRVTSPLPSHTEAQPHAAHRTNVLFTQSR